MDNAFHWIGGLLMLLVLAACSPLSAIAFLLLTKEKPRPKLILIQGGKK